MNALRALQKLESDLLAKLAPIYKCDEEDVPVDIDLLRIYNDDKNLREPQLVSMVFCLTVE